MVKKIYMYCILYLANNYHVCAVCSTITFGDTRGRGKDNSAIALKNINESVLNIHVAATVHVTKGKTRKWIILILENE